MGVRLNWLAVKRGDKAALLERLDLVARGVSSDEFGSAVCCAEFPDGWLVLVSEGMGLDLDEALPPASAGGLALGCEVEEHVMFSRLRAFHDGLPVWAVTHDPDLDLNGVAIEGEAPSAVRDIRTALAAEWGADEDVDYMFDVPVRLGQQLCGYAHDDLHPVTWTILERPGRRRDADAPSRLPEAFRSELLPCLQASGWSLAAGDPDYRGRAWDVTRVVEGRRQALGFRWSERGLDLQFETRFAVFDDKNDVLISGEVLPFRAGARPERPLWRRIVDGVRGVAVEPEPAADRLAELVTRVKDDFAAVEAFLVSGEETPRIHVRNGPGRVA